MRLDNFPPTVCRLLARQPGAKGKSQTPLTDQEIADASGLRVDQVASISWLCTWDNVPAQVMLKFALACGIDFGDYKVMQKHYKFVRRMAGRWLTGNHYLKRHPDWDMRWKPLVENYIQFLQWQASSKH